MSSNPSPQGEPYGLNKDMWNVLIEGRGNQPCQPRCSFPFIEKAWNTHCKAAWVCIPDHPELTTCHILLDTDYGLKKKKKDSRYHFLISNLLINIFHVYIWKVYQLYISKIYHPLQYHQVTGHKWHTGDAWHMWTVDLKWTCYFLKGLLVTWMQERWVLRSLQNEDMEASLLFTRWSMFHSFRPHN